MKHLPRLLRRAPSLVSYWKDDRLVFDNSATCSRISAHPLTSQILQFFDRWRSVDALTASLGEYNPTSVRAAVVELARHSLLIRSDRPGEARAAALASSSSWNPAAGFFHLSTKDVPYSPDQSIDAEFLRRKTRRFPEPLPLK